jgi:hypothetical protein
LLVNPGLDGNASGWNLNSTASHSTTDVDDCSGSGSVELDALLDTFNQCVPASPGQTYFFGHRFNGGAIPTGIALCSITFLPAGASCSVGSPSLGGGSGALASNADDWVLASGSAISPPNTAQILFHCSTAGAAFGNFDQLYLSTVNQGF